MMLPIFKRSTLLWLASSLILVSFGQPYLFSFFSFFSSVVGYAFFWKSMLDFSNKTKRFWLTVVWFGVVQSIQLSWLTSDKYVGSYIFILYFALVIALGLEFGLISLLVRKNLSFLRMLAIAGGWALLEWSRLFILTGFTWSSVGLALTNNIYSSQFVSVGGIFLLSFWVFLTNLLSLRLINNAKQRLYQFLWICVAATPYFFGYLHLLEKNKAEDKNLEILLVQSATSPDEKLSFVGSREKSLHPLEQWKRLLILLKKYQGHSIDLIVFPEAVVPYGTDLPIYKVEDVAAMFKEILGVKKENFLSSLSSNVGNKYWAESIANCFQSDVIIGLEDIDELEQKSYNAAFFIEPNKSTSQRYEKRVLVPMGEFILPFEWCKAILANYGIVDSFSPGKEAKIFYHKKASLGPSICYEETYGHLMRENRLKGAELLVNLTNDVWYPRSKLPLVHFSHGRLRAIENGIPLIRACNTGFTCGINSFGELVGFLEPEKKTHSAQPDVLFLKIPLQKIETLYTKFGDDLIVYSAILFVFVAFFFRKSMQ